MGLGTQALKLPKLPKLPRREGAHFLSLITGGAVLMTVFFLLVSTASERTQYDEEGPGPNPPVWRRKSLERLGGRKTQSYSMTATSRSGSGGRGTLAAELERTLVVYLHSNSDPVYQNNMNYFIKHGILANDGCDYVLVMQGLDSPQAMAKLPRLPDNARYHYGQQMGCKLHWGMLAEVFESGVVKKEDYRYFIFMSSAVRGPFVPTYALEDKHWSQYFTQKLTNQVKLVGPTISCEQLKAPEGAVLEQLPPRVQFTAVATDQVGLGVLEADGRVLKCHNGSDEERWHSELGASAAILRSNFSIDSFLTRYRKVDWTNTKNWECNQRKNPLSEFNYDGSSIHPYETMFVPMDTIAIENGWSFAKLAALYETWLTLQDQGDNDVSTNLWVTDPWPIKRQRIAYMQSRGPGCFDNRYYLQKNPDLKVIPTVLELWDHFVMMGQFEGRSFRWSCEDDRKLPWE